MKVHEVMTSDVISVKTDTPFRELVELMSDRRISGVPVVDELGQILGMVTEGDLITKEHRGNPVGYHPPFPREAKSDREFLRRIGGRVAGQMMTTPAVTVGANDDLRVAARLMSLHRIGSLPVVAEDGRLIGIVSRADVLRVFLRSDDEIRQEIESALLRHILSDISTVDVAVRDGVATLRGSVQDPSTAQSLAYHVDRIDGIACIQNELSCNSDDIQVRA